MARKGDGLCLRGKGDKATAIPLTRRSVSIPATRWKSPPSLYTPVFAYRRDGTQWCAQAGRNSLILLDVRRTGHQSF